MNVYFLDISVEKFTSLQKFSRKNKSQWKGISDSVCKNKLLQSYVAIFETTKYVAIFATTKYVAIFATTKAIAQRNIIEFVKILLKDLIKNLINQIFISECESFYHNSFLFLFTMLSSCEKGT